MIRAVVFDLGQVLASPPDIHSHPAGLLGVATDDFAAGYWTGRQDYDEGGSDADYWGPLLSGLGLAPDAESVALLAGSDAVVALPGGCGTLEEVFEAITLKRLGLYFKPIIFVNTNGFYDRLRDFLDHTIRERMLSAAHGAMWQFVDGADDVLPAIHGSDAWPENAREFAALKPA